MPSRARAITARARSGRLTQQQREANQKQDPNDLSKLGMGLPGTNVKQRVGAYRQQQQAAGVTGPALRKAIQAYRPTARAQRKEELMGQLPEDVRPWVKHPATFLHKHGQQPFGRLAGIRTADEALGFTKDQIALREHLAQQLTPEGTAKVDYREAGEPLMTQDEKYLQERLGQGFTPQERAAYYGSLHDPLMSMAQQANEDQMTKLSAAGIDPRSGVANARAAQVQQATAKGLAEAGRETEEANLQRKQQIEQEAGQMSALEESRRSNEVQSQLGRLATIEAGMGGMANLGENQRQFDYELAEGQRQAALRRQDIASAAAKMEPSTLEKVSGGLQGFMAGIGA